MPSTTFIARVTAITAVWLNEVNRAVFDLEQTLTLANGANQNVVLPENAGLLISSAPTAVSS